MKYGPKRKEETGRWRKMNDDEPYYLYSSVNNFLLDQIKEGEMGRTCIKQREDTKKSIQKNRKNEDLCILGYNAV
jgi:hypothetical protein